MGFHGGIRLIRDQTVADTFTGRSGTRNGNNVDFNYTDIVIDEMDGSEREQKC